MNGYGNKDRVKISIYNLMILMNNFLKAKADPSIGYMELFKTETEFLREVNLQVNFPTDLIESLLYYANMVDENNDFWHPTCKSFRTLVLNVLPSDLYFDTEYNQITYIGDK